MTEIADTIVQSGEVPIAVRDFGGDGTPVVLLHGAGGNLADWSLFAPRLASRYRVVALDLRGHGHSGDGPWHWDAIVDDVTTVVAALGLESPALVGMSLGGMAAVAWAHRHPDCRAAVNIDGPHRLMDEETQYHGLVGVDPAVVDEELARLRASFDAQAAMTAQPFTAAQVTALCDQRRTLAGDDDALADAFEASFRRNLVDRDGKVYLRPSPEALTALRVAMAELDLLRMYREAQRPVLVLTATRDLLAQQQFPVLARAYRDGLRRDLATVTAESSMVRVEEIDDDHGMVFHQPARVADRVHEFLADCL